MLNPPRLERLALLELPSFLKLLRMVLSMKSPLSRKFKKNMVVLVFSTSPYKNISIWPILTGSMMKFPKL